MAITHKHHQLIKSNPLFEGLSDDDYMEVMNHSKLYDFKPDEALFRQHEVAQDFFYIFSGTIKLSLLSIDGAEKVIDIIHHGQTFAEAIIFQNLPTFPVSASALKDSEVLRINADAYTKVLRHSPSTCINVITALSIRLHWSVQELDRLSLHNATYRLVSYLLESIPPNTTDPTTIDLSIAKHIIASRISVTPETLSRTLKRLSQQKLLKVHDKYITLLDPFKLREMISI